MTPAPFASLAPQVRDFVHLVIARLREPTPTTSLDLLEAAHGELAAMSQAITWLGASGLIEYRAPSWRLVANENVEGAPSQEAL